MTGSSPNQADERFQVGGLGKHVESDRAVDPITLGRCDTEVACKRGGVAGHIDQSFWAWQDGASLEQVFGALSWWIEHDHVVLAFRRVIGVADRDACSEPSALQIAAARFDCIRVSFDGHQGLGQSGEPNREIADSAMQLENPHSGGLGEPSDRLGELRVDAVIRLGEGAARTFEHATVLNGDGNSCLTPGRRMSVIACSERHASNLGSRAKRFASLEQLGRLIVRSVQIDHDTIGTSQLELNLSSASQSLSMFSLP